MKSSSSTNLRLGILGGGQLGRMSALAAARLGIQVVIFTDEKNSPASQVASKTIIAAYSDKKALKEFSRYVDVISYEFENIPVETVCYLTKLKPVYPDDKLLEISQDRLKEKAFLNKAGIETARWKKVEEPTELARILHTWETESCILKTTRFGYDGKGQLYYTNSINPEEAFRKLKSRPLIAEEVVDFLCEISVIVARDMEGKISVYGPMLNEHKNHILSRTIFPADIDDKFAAKAAQIAKKLARKLNLRGVLTLEMFVTKDGRILANEIAPRTHNSGHWTIDACAVSQFEQHVRTVCGLPVGSAAAHSDAVMINLIGNDASRADKYLKRKDACLHLYGKHTIKPGRKMGHVTLLRSKTDGE